MDATTKEQALDFLRELEETLNKNLLGPADMESWIRSTVKAAKTDDTQKQLRLPEAAFLNGKALPVLFDFLKTHFPGQPEEQARQSLLNEYYRTTPGISRQSPIRWERHPFKKVLGASASDIYRGWAEPAKGHALTQSCPDFSVREPFPHSVLFEGKYFSRGSLDYAQRQLVTDIYQAFFYRGLPRLAPTKQHPEWNYEYACLMAYDASPKGTLAAAWAALPLQTRRGLWEGANVYVMILRGSGA